MLHTGLTRFRGACRRGGRRERLLRLHGGNIDYTAGTRKSVCEGRCKANGKICRIRGKNLSRRLCGRFADKQGREEKNKAKNPLKHFVSEDSDCR